MQRRVLRVRGTAVTLLDQVREQAVADLQFDIEFESLDFLTCQRKAAMDPENYDVYEQCFHNLDIVWYWGALQPIDTQRIAEWDRIGDLAKTGGISKYMWPGYGDAPVRKLYVQPDGMLGQQQMRHISMLPTAHNVDSFGYDTRVFGDLGPEGASWSWLLDPRAKGRIALVDELSYWPFRCGLGRRSDGRSELRRYRQHDNRRDRSADGPVGTAASAGVLLRFVGDCRGCRGAVAPGSGLGAKHVGAFLREPGCDVGFFAEASPREGYRAWHGGGSLSRHLSGAKLDMAYDYLNWWLTGPAGAVMARQGYYMTVPERVREALSPEEWKYWYEGAPAGCDLSGPSGKTVVKAGARRAGGSYRERISRISVWNTVMDEYNYAARAWNRFIRSVNEGAA